MNPFKDDSRKRLLSESEIAKKAIENKENALRHISKVKDKFKDPDLYEKLKKLIEAGFDQIKFFGGTSKDKEWYSGIAPYSFDTKKNDFDFLVAPYNSTVHLNEEQDVVRKSDNSPEATALRELFEETGLIAKEADLELLGNKKVSSTHEKHFFGCEKWVNQPLKLAGNPNPVDSETGEPLWICGYDLILVLWPGHYWMLKAFGEKKAMIKEMMVAAMPFIELKG